MRDRLRRIMIVLSVMVAILCAIIFGAQKAHVIAATTLLEHRSSTPRTILFLTALCLRTILIPDVVNA